MTPILGEESTQKMSGLQKKSENTVRTRPTTTSGGLSKEALFAELLKDLSGNNFPQLASVLLPKLGSRDTMPRRRRRRRTISRNRRKREYESDSDDSYYDDSASFSSGGRKSTHAGVSESDSEESAFGTDEEALRFAAQTRLAPLPGQENFRGLGPRI